MGSSHDSPHNDPLRDDQPLSQSRDHSGNAPKVEFDFQSGEFDFSEDSPTTTSTPSNPTEDEFEFDSDGGEMFDDSELDLSSEILDSELESANSIDNDSELEAEVQARELDDASYVDTLESPSAVEDDESSVNLLDDNSDEDIGEMGFAIRDDLMIGESDSSFELETVDNILDPNDAHHPSPAVKTIARAWAEQRFNPTQETWESDDAFTADSLVPDDFDATDAESTEFSVDAPPFKEEQLPAETHADSQLLPGDSQLPDSTPSPESPELRLGQPSGLISKLMTWIKRDSGETESAEKRIAEITDRVDQQRNSPLEPRDEFSRVAPGQESLAPTMQSPTIDLTTSTTEQISPPEIPNDSELVDPTVEPIENPPQPAGAKPESPGKDEVFNLERPSSIAAAEAEAREGASSAEFDFSKDVVFESEPDHPGANSANADPGIAESAPEQPDPGPSARDTLVPEIDPVSESGDKPRSPPFTEFASATPPLSASDTVREPNVELNTSEFDKERFSLLQSQIDELERENELLNNSLKAATEDADRAGILSAKVSAIESDLDQSRTRESTLKSTVDDLRSELETTQLQLEGKISVEEHGDLKRQFDESSEANQSLTLQLDQAKSDLEKQLSDIDELTARLNGALEEVADLSQKVADAAAPSNQTRPDQLVDANSDPELDLLAKVDPDFLKRFELRLKKEHKKRRAAERHLEQAEKQRDEIAKQLRDALKKQP